MAASLDRSPRRRRYTRRPEEGRLALTPQKLLLLRSVAEYGIASLPQLSALACSSPKSARRHLRELFDHGLVDVTPVARVALAEPACLNDAALLYGSAPNIYTLTHAGLKVLGQLGLAGPAELRPQRYGPKNSLFLAHELAVRDVRAWFDLAARACPAHRLAVWKDGPAAEIDLRSPRPPKMARPDAWLVYAVGEKVLVGLVEVDRGSERGGRRWQEKLAAYEALFQSGRLREVTGYANARVLVVVPDAHRRDHLAQFIAGGAPAALAGRFWLADRSILVRTDLHQSEWRQPGSHLLRPLLPSGTASAETTAREAD